MKVSYKVDVFKGDPEKVKREIDAIVNRNGSATPEQVVDAARDERSELHKCFTWDDHEAAEKWRREEARKLIISLVVEDEKKPEMMPVRCYVTTERKAGYKKIETVVNNLSEYERLLGQALAELEAFEKKYKSLMELRRVFEEIEALVA